MFMIDTRVEVTGRGLRFGQRGTVVAATDVSPAGTEVRVALDDGPTLWFHESHLWELPAREQHASEAAITAALAPAGEYVPRHAATEVDR
jgi:hypothetical protein